MKIIIKCSLVLIIFAAGCSSCSRVSYKDVTPSTKCNFTLMMIKLKSIKGNETFEVGKYMEKCFEDLDKIKQEKENN